MTDFDASARRRRPEPDLATVLMIVAAVGLAVRLPLAWAAPVVSPDGAASLRVAGNILMHACISMSEPVGGACVPSWGGNHLPGYPAFIAAIWLIAGHSVMAVTVVQSVVAVVAGLRLAYATAMFAGSTIAGLVVGLLFAISPVGAAWGRFILPDGLFLAAAACLFAEILLSLQQGRLRTAPMALAVLCGALLRFDGILLAIPALICAFRIHPLKQALQQAALAALLVATPISLLVARNVAIGLPLIPRTGMHDGSVPPAGYLAWGGTWITTLYDGAAMFFPVAQYNYRDIAIPPDAYAGADERRQVQDLLARLRAHHGDPFPPDIDRAFAELAAHKRADHPIDYYVVVPASRMAVFWLQPFASFGWPLEVADWLSVDELRRFEGGSAATRIDVLLSHPLLVLGKSLVFGYRLLLVLGGIAAIVLLWRRDRRGQTLALALAAYAVLRTVLLSLQFSIDPRYTVTSMAAIELLIALAAFFMWQNRARRNARPG